MILPIAVSHAPESAIHVDFKRTNASYVPNDVDDPERVTQLFIAFVG